MYDGFFTSLDDPLPRPRRRGHPRRRLRDADALLLARLHQPRPRRPQAGRRSRGGDDPRRPPARRAGGRLPRPQRPALSGRRAASRGSSGSSACIEQRPARRPRARRRSSGWRTTTRTASGSTPSSPRSRTSSSNCSTPIPDRDAFRRAVRPVQRHRRRGRPDRAAARPSPTGSSACTPATATSPKGRRWRSSARPTARSATRRTSGTA